MELLLILFLIIAILSLFLITRQERIRAYRLNRGLKGYNSHKDYLEEVKEATKKRFEEEASQQAYKNNLKKDI